MSKKLDEMLSNVFRSQEKSDWESKKSWQRRALMWKLLVMGIYACEDNQRDELKKVIQNSFKGDLITAPHIDYVEKLYQYCVSIFNSKMNTATNEKKPKIEVVKQ